MFYVYILYSSSANRFYIGQTQDLQQRLQRHNNGYESATKPFIPWELKCAIQKNSRSEAIVLEAKLKNLNKNKLLAFIQKYS
ncbi:MAG: GIY-YIG nuclease family protein [Sediminibacterium sp.]|nr:GIY-YIG nuclease family protein [Sediminibacterium sp.]